MVSDTVKASDLEVGYKLKDRNHPEWGVWVIMNHYDENLWEIRGDSGDKILFESELDNWERFIGR